MRLLVEGLLLAVALGAGAVFADRVLRARARAKRMRPAYFSGGPLDGQKRPMLEFAETITSGDAIYRHNGMGVYTYVGTVRDENALSYDVEP